MTMDADSTYSSDMSVTSSSESETSYLENRERKKSPNITKNKKSLSQEKPFVCNYCSKRLSTERGLKIHVSRKHCRTALHGSNNPRPSEKRFVCNYCSKRLLTERGLKIHVSKKHCHTALHGSSKPRPLEKRYSSNDCSKRSCIKLGSKTYVSKKHCHKSLPYSCGSCKKTFCDSSCLHSHKCIPLYRVKGLHPCPFCELQFKEQTNVNLHVKIVHRKESPRVSTYACDHVNVTETLCSHHPRDTHPVSRQEEGDSSGTMSDFNLQLDSDSDDLDSESDDPNSDPGELIPNLRSVSAKLQVQPLQHKVIAPPKPDSHTSCCYGTIQATHKSNDQPNVTVHVQQVECEHNYGNQQATPINIHINNPPDWPMQGLKQLLQVYREHSYAREIDDGQFKLSKSRVEDTPEMLSDNMAAASKPPDLLSKQPVGTGRDLNGRYIWVYDTVPH